MPDLGATAAAVLYTGGAVVLFGVRSWQQRRATGSTGFNGFSRNRGNWAKAAGLLFGVALLAGLAAPALAATGVTDIVRPDGVWEVALSWAGLLLTTAGFVLAALAQQDMGRSWRIGVDPTDNTELVTGGLFALARNPIFTGMIAAQAGTVLLAPTGLGMVGVLLLVLACELQVRRVEEPYLTRTHGAAYDAYAHQVGRFLPGLGRGLEPSTTTPAGSR